jgi:FxsC-like protein
MHRRIPEISEQTFLHVEEDVQEKLLWRDEEYIKLVTLLFGKTRQLRFDKDNLRLEITLSLLTSGRSAAKVLKLAFTDDANRQNTFIIRVLPTKKDAEKEVKNVKELINAADCFADLIGKQFNIPNRYLVIYRHVTDNVGEPVDELCKRLRQSLSSDSNAKMSRQFEKVIDSNFQGFIKQVTKKYEEVKDYYKTVRGSQYCQGIISQLPPDLVISNAYVYEAESKGWIVKPQDKALSIEQLEAISITQVLSKVSENHPQIQSNFLRIKEKLCFEGQEVFLTGLSQTAYLPLFIMKSNKQRVRIWIKIDKNDAQRIEANIDTIKEYELIVLEKEITTFTTQLEIMGFDTQSCISTVDFQAFCQQRYRHLHTDMRHNDLHCGNVLVSGSHFKVIDVGDMTSDLIASDIARLEVSLWFEVANHLSKQEAEVVLNNLTKGSTEWSTSSSKVSILSLILHKLNKGFREGVESQELLKESEIELAYVIQILLYQRYCLLDGVKEVPPAFNVLARHWISQFLDSENDIGIDKQNHTISPHYVKFVYVAGCANELQSVRNDVSAYGEIAMDWKPHYPPVEKEIVIVAQQACSDAGLVFGEILLDEQLIQHIENFQKNSDIIIIIVDPWTLRLSQYAAIMQQYDKYHFVSCTVLVTFNFADPETRQQYSKLRETLEETFVNKTIDTNFDSFRDNIKSMEEFTSELVNALQNAKKKMMKFAEKMRKIKSKDKSPSKPKVNL